MAADPGPPPGTWSLVVPVKVLARAKSRLTPVAGPRRRALALAMAADTVAAALRAGSVAGVLVVTSDELVAEVVAGLGAAVAADEPAAGLNPALRHGAALAAARWPGTALGALAGDLPALRPAELGAALREAARARAAFVRDAGGTGTTLYTAIGTAAFAPHFGPASAARHAAAGAAEIRDAGLDSVRRDVDAPPDLAAATALGVGPRTTAVLAELDGGQRRRPG